MDQSDVLFIMQNDAYLGITQVVLDQFPHNFIENMWQGAIAKI